MNVAAVVVTYNRYELLKECIDAIRAQSRPVDRIIVINNGSTDETACWLDEQSDILAVHQENVGGAGGFYEGIKRVYLSGSDWIWAMDDDTIPAGDALEKLIMASELDSRFGVLCSHVKWTDGRPNQMNVPVFGESKLGEHPTLYADSGVLLLKHCSFVSMFISKEAVKRCGYPIKEFFIWADDVEYSSRIGEKFLVGFVSDSIVEHKTLSNDIHMIRDVDPARASRFYYFARNWIYLRKRTMGWKRWISVFHFIAWMFREAILRNKNRFTFLRHILRGTISGIFFSPAVEIPN